ncbi:MAG: DUF4127 family protein, partial [Armatimonadota bacterium]|nr:DUF4127 family protein [Armatimonadota bacterium]
LLLPLDDRPPSRVFPQRLAEIAGVELRVAPQNLLGRFLQPGDCRSLADWMFSEVMDADAVIVSADMLCYGGLVASRVPDVSRREALRQIRMMARLKGINPDVKVFCSSAIMRLTITSSDAYRQQWAEPIFQFSQESESAIIGHFWLSQPSSLPPYLVQPYLEARKRNFGINERLIQEVGRGAIDYLCLTQEDCAPTGLHRFEQAALRRSIQRLSLEDRVEIYPGADEAAMTLLARAVMTLSGTSLSFKPVYWSSSFGDTIPPYEDRPLNLSVAAQFRAAGCSLGSDNLSGLTANGAADETTPVETDEISLAIWGGEKPDGAGDLTEQFLSWAAALLSRGGRVALVDAARPNGADDQFMQRLADESPTILAGLSSFAAWNTAGNSLGTAIAHAVCLHYGTRKGSHRPLAHYRFLFERLVDDWAYQSSVRGEINAELQQRGIFAGSLGAAAESVEAEIRQRLLPLATEIFDAQFKGVQSEEGTLAELKRLEVKLPWPRTFEVELSALFGVTAAAS